ncbi:MAG: L,D-transpeptidase family protein, partial [Hyphomicrobiaceae bacterium]
MRLTHTLLATAILLGFQTTAFAVEPGAPTRLLSYDILISDQLERDLAATRVRKGDDATPAIKAFYAERNFQPLWITGKGFGPSAKKAIAEIRRAGDYGLDASKFSLPPIVASGSVADRIADEMALTHAVLEYAVHARGGRIDPRSLSVYLDRSGYLVPPEKVLASVAATSAPDEYLRSLQPQHAEFKRLQKRYLALRDNGESKKQIRIPRGPKLRLGKKHPHVALLRKRLGLELSQPVRTTDAEGSDPDDFDAYGDRLQPAPPDPNEFDETLDEAVREFQTKNGLMVDGIVGRGTRAALNGDGVDQTKRILVNMERWRWMPQDLGNYYVWANVPDYKFYVMKNGRVIHSERIIVGKYRNQTATFSDEMEEIVFNPRWNVPRSIKENELLPGLLRSPNALARQGLRVRYRGREIDPVSVDWAVADMRRFHIYQPPGPRNALGRVKFLFPNKHAIYMHDTPSKRLFKRSTRTFSHGCVRVRNPMRLAEVLLAHDQGMSPATIRRFVRRGARDSVFLKRKIPVHITYFTARA